MTAICFSLGFLATNYGFAGSAASFVETVKAAEPLTSATVAAVYGIEIITLPQKVSLGAIIAGVLLSTLGHGGSSTSQKTLSESIIACAIVMTSNMFFSFRGLYQKLLRRHASAQVLDDLNLQFRMQWLGVLLLVVPTLLFDCMPYLWYLTTTRTSNAHAVVPRILAERHDKHSADAPASTVIIFRYCQLALLNGFAFTSYNLASTYILSRISVVHHAVINCIRRVFAIVVTSVLFEIPITDMGAAGICLAVVGFMLYTHYKVQQQQSSSQQRHLKHSLSSLLPVSLTQ
jgi:solute carrier family 35 protein E1